MSSEPDKMQRKDSFTKINEDDLDFFKKIYKKRTERDFDDTKFNDLLKKFETDRDKVLRTAYDAEEVLPICVSSFHGSQPEIARLCQVPENVILCLRNYFGKISYTDSIRGSKEYTDIWTKMDLQSRKELFMKKPHLYSTRIL